MDKALNKREYCRVSDDWPLRRCTRAEATAHLLRGLISYHERMTVGLYPDRDFYKDGLRYALELVEREIKNQQEPESNIRDAR